jgi:hypothetical protein
MSSTSLYRQRSHPGSHQRVYRPANRPVEAPYNGGYQNFGHYENNVTNHNYFISPNPYRSTQSRYEPAPQDYFRPSDPHSSRSHYEPSQSRLTHRNVRRLEGDNMYIKPFDKYLSCGTN